LPSGQEAQGWVNYLLGGSSEEQMMSAILGSQEFYARAQTLVKTGTADQRFVQSLAQVTLNRGLSSSEATLWLGLQPKLGNTTLARAFVNSAEFRSTIVRNDYTTLLGRPGTSAEVAGWATSPISLQAIREVFLLCQEFVNRV
jgi:hypothetical protein